MLWPLRNVSSTRSWQDGDWEAWPCEFLTCSETDLDFWLLECERITYLYNCDHGKIRKYSQACDDDSTIEILD